MVRKKSKLRSSASSAQVPESTPNSFTLSDETLAQANAHRSHLPPFPLSLSPLSTKIILVVLMMVLIVLFSLLFNSEVTSSLRSNSNSMYLGASLLRATIGSTEDHAEMKDIGDRTSFRETPNEIVSYYDDDDGSGSRNRFLTYGGSAGAGAVEKAMSGVTIQNPINEGLCIGKSMEKYSNSDVSNNDSAFWLPRVLASYSTSAASTTTSGSGQSSSSSHTAFLLLNDHYAGGNSVTAFSVPTNDFYTSSAAMAGGIRREQMHWRPSKCPNDAHWMVPWAVERGREARMVAEEINRLVRAVMSLLLQQEQTKRKGLETFYSRLSSKIKRCLESSRQYRLHDERPHFLCHENNVKLVRNAVYRTLMATTRVDNLHPSFIRPTNRSSRGIGVIGLSLPSHLPRLLNRLVRLLGWRIVDVGANKGYTVASFIDLLLPSTELDAETDESMGVVDLSSRDSDGSVDEGNTRGKRSTNNKENCVVAGRGHGNYSSRDTKGALRSTFTGVDFDTLVHLISPPATTKRGFGGNNTKAEANGGKEESSARANVNNRNDGVVESSVGNVGVVRETRDTWRTSDFYEMYGKNNRKNRPSHETRSERQRPLGGDGREDRSRLAVDKRKKLLANAGVLKKVVASGTHPYGPLWLGSELFQKFHINSHNHQKSEEEASNPNNGNNKKRTPFPFLPNPNGLCGGCCECIGNYNSASSSSSSSHSARGKETKRGSSDHEKEDVFKSLRAAFRGSIQNHSHSSRGAGSSTGGHRRVYGGHRERDVLCLRPALLTKWAWLKHSPENRLTKRESTKPKRSQHHDDNHANPSNKNGQQALIGTESVVSLISEFVYFSLLFITRKTSEELRGLTFSEEEELRASAISDLNFICEGGHGGGDENGVVKTESVENEVRIGRNKVEREESGDSLFALFKPAFVTIHAFEPSDANFKWLTHYFRSPSSLHLKRRERQRRDVEAQFDNPKKKIHKRLAANYLFQDRRGGLELHIFRKAVGSHDSSHQEIGDGEFNIDDNNTDNDNGQVPSGIFEGEVSERMAHGAKNAKHSTENSSPSKCKALSFTYGDILSQLDERRRIGGSASYSCDDEEIKETEMSFFSEIVYRSSVSADFFEEKRDSSQQGTTENAQRRRKKLSSARPTKRRYVLFPDVELGSEVGAIAATSSKIGEEVNNQIDRSDHKASLINPNPKPRLSPVELTSLDEHFLQNLLGLDLDAEREEGLLSGSTQRENSAMGAAEENEDGANDQKEPITFDGVIKSAPIHTRDDSKRPELPQKIRKQSNATNLMTSNEGGQIAEDGSTIHFFNPFLSPYAIDKNSMFSITSIDTKEIIINADPKNESEEGATLCIDENKLSLQNNDEEKEWRSSSSVNLFSSSLPLIDHLVTDAQGHDVEVFNGASLLFSRGDIASYQLELGRQANYYDMFVKNLGKRRRRSQRKRERRGKSTHDHPMNDVEKKSFGSSSSNNGGAFTYSCYFPTESKKGQSVPTHVRINHGNAPRHAAAVAGTSLDEDMEGKSSLRRGLRARKGFFSDISSSSSHHNCWKKWYESASGWINVFCVKREERLDLSQVIDSYDHTSSRKSADRSKRKVIKDCREDGSGCDTSSQIGQIALSLPPPPPPSRLSNGAFNKLSPFLNFSSNEKVSFYFGRGEGKSFALPLIPLHTIGHLFYPPASLSDIMDHIENSMAHRKAAGFCPSNALQQRIIAHMLKSTQQQP